MSLGLHPHTLTFKMCIRDRCYGERVEKPEDIHNALKRALKANESGQSAILDFIVDYEDVAEGFKAYKKL